ALVVAGPVRVGLAEVAGDDGPVDRAHDVAQADLGRLAGQDVAAAHAPLGADQSRPLEGQQDLFEVGLGQPGALGDGADGCGSVAVGVEREGEQVPGGVVASSGDLHRAQRYPETTRPLPVVIRSAYTVRGSLAHRYYLG